MFENDILIEKNITDIKDLSDNDIQFLRLLTDIKKLSPAIKRKVGAIIGYSQGEEDWVISQGFNHMLNGLSTSSCEDEKGETYDCVIHSEESAIIDFLQKKHTLKYFSHDKIAIYVTYSPCMNCSKLIVQAGIKNLFYIQRHKSNFHIGDMCPLQFLIEAGVTVNKVDDNLFQQIITARK